MHTHTHACVYMGRRSEFDVTQKPNMNPMSEKIVRKKEREDGDVMSRPFLERVEHTLEQKNTHVQQIAQVRCMHVCIYVNRVGKTTNVCTSKSACIRAYVYV
jgi:hypothetical protein